MSQIFKVYEYEPVDSNSNNLRKRICGPNLFLRYTFCWNPIFAFAADEYHNLDLVRYVYCRICTLQYL